MDLKNIVILVIGLLNLALGVLIYSKNLRERTNRAFFWLALSLVGWSITMVLYRYAPTVEDSIILAKVLYATAAFVASFALYFSILFPSSLAPSLRFSHSIAVFSFGIILAAASLLGDLIVSDVKIPPSGEKILIFGSLYPLYVVYIIGYFSATFAIMWRRYIRAVDIAKKQIQFFLIGSLFSALVGNFSNLILPTLGIFTFNWLGQVVTIVMLVFIAYAITTYRLLNVGIIATEIFVAILGITLFIDIFFSTSFAITFFKVLIFLLAIIFGILLLRSVWREVQQREQLENLTKQLQLANVELKKLDEAKSEFISIASHQLRGPLTAIRGYLSMIREGSFGPASEKIVSALSKVEQSSNMLLRLVEDLLDLSKIEAGKMPYNYSTFDLNEIVSFSVETFRDVARQKHLDLILEKSPQTLRVKADRDKMASILGNVIENAILYTDQGLIKVTTKKIEDHALISVEDTGVGLFPDEKYDIFLRFRRGEGSHKRHVGGLGLGLYIARKVLQDHGGQIWADSQGKGKGSTFYISLPLM